MSYEKNRVKQQSFRNKRTFKKSNLKKFVDSRTGTKNFCADCKFHHNCDRLTASHKACEDFEKKGF